MLSRSRESPRQSLNASIRLNSSETRADRITTMTETCLDCKEKVVAFSSCKVLKLCPCKQFLLWFHHRFIVIAKISNRALVTTGVFVDADALPMAQQGLVEIVDAAGIQWQQGLQEGMGRVGCDFFADQSQASRHAVDMHIDRKYRFLATE